MARTFPPALTIPDFRPAATSSLTTSSVAQPWPRPHIEAHLRIFQIDCAGLFVHHNLLQVGVPRRLHQLLHRRQTGLVREVAAVLAVVMPDPSTAPMAMLAFPPVRSRHSLADSIRSMMR